MNLIGRQVSRLRYQRGWTQDMLADKLQLAGWMISRSGVSKIEGGLMYVPDFRLLYFAYTFQVDLPILFPEVNLRSPIHETTNLLWKTFRKQKRRRWQNGSPTRSRNQPICWE